MSYRIAQDQHYLGTDRWKWSAWIEASVEELDQVEVVTWILHPTFTPSRIESRARDKHFRLERSGWGTFMLRAQLQRNGESSALILKHNLKLDYPDDSEIVPSRNATGDDPAPRARANRPKVFLSYSSEDKLHAQEIRSMVENLGAQVLDPSTISSDLPIEAATRKMIRESDAVMSVVGSEYLSPWVVAQMKLAQAEEKPVVTMLPEHAPWPTDLSNEIQSVRFGTDPSALNDALASFVGKLRK
jgi:hypothetical protein